MEFKDYYAIMGVARDATGETIRRVYRQLARQYHPDVSKSPDAEARFKEVGAAYAVLKDAEKRAAYDELCSRWKAGQDFRPPPDWNAGFSGASSNAAGPGDFSDFFAAFYGYGAARRSQRDAVFDARGEDRHATLSIDLEDSYAGALRTVSWQRPEIDAQGRVSLHTQKLEIRIPRGIHAGQQIRLAGQGGPGSGQGKPGDLYVDIGFAPHARYRVEHRDVYLELPLAPWEAALGATIDMPTPSGAVALRIPAGSVGGSKLRLKGRGLPGRTPGDFYATLNIALPPADSETASGFYHDMNAQFKSFEPRSGLAV